MLSSHEKEKHLVDILKISPMPVKGFDGFASRNDNLFQHQPTPPIGDAQAATKIFTVSNSSELKVSKHHQEKKNPYLTTTDQGAQQGPSKAERGSANSIGTITLETTHAGL
jgi:hypothetical protein